MLQCTMQHIISNHPRLKWIFVFYVISLYLIGILPINSTESSINNIYIIDFRLDYVLHSVLFIPWFILHRFCLSARIKYIIVFGITSSILTECLQLFTPYRTFNINDMLANVMGFVLGALYLLIEYWILKVKFAKQKS